MSALGRSRCPDCGTQLRRGRGAGERCGPCQREGLRITLPEAFYDRPALEAALASWDFAPVFLAVRAAHRPEPWSREMLGAFLGWDQRRILAIETGRSPLVDVRAVVWVANQLGIPAGKLGFVHGVTVGGGKITGRSSGVQRRNFVEHAASLTVATGVTGLDVDRVRALLPHAEPTGIRHVGAADVEALEQATAAFVRQDAAQGSGLFQAAALTQVHAVLPLFDAQATPEVRCRLLLAAAHLANQAGYMSFDVNQHDAARQLGLIALDIARAAEDPRSSDLTVFVLYDMALQAVSLSRPDEALRLVHLGHAVAAGPHPVSAYTISCLATIQAKAHAAQGDAAGCDRALGQAEEHFAAIEATPHGPWGSFLDDTMLAGFQGHAHYTLALARRDPRAAGRAVPLLRHAVDSFGPGHARSRALYLADLSGAHALAGDIDTAVTLGHQSIDAITAVHSPRIYGRLRVLNTALEPVRTSAGVAELRERLRVTAG